MVVAVSNQFRVSVRAKGSGALGIPNRVFVARPQPSVTGVSPFNRASTPGSKHVKWTNDKTRGRVLTFGGDFTNIGGTQSAVPELYAYTASTDTWQMISPYCHGPGSVTPSRPNDGQPFVHDTQRDRYWALPGGWDNVDGQTCSINGGAPKPSVAGSTFYRGLMWMNPNTGAWTGASKTIATGALNSGYYDPVQDCIIAIDDDGPPSIWRLFLSSMTVQKTPWTVGSTFDGVNPFYNWPTARYDDFAVDIVGRKGYCINSWVFMTAGGTPIRSEHRLFSFSLDNPSTQQILAPPPYNSPAHAVHTGSDGVHHPVFDTLNGRVIWPYCRNICGIVYGVGVYNPATNTWESFDVSVSDPVAAPVMGNSWVFDETHNALIGCGGVFCGDSDPAEAGASSRYYYLWRYA